MASAARTSLEQTSGCYPDALDTRMYIYIYTYMYTYLHVCIYLYVCVYMYVFIYEDMWGFPKIRSLSWEPKYI